MAMVLTTISDCYGQFLLMKNLSNKKNIVNTEVYYQDFQKINEKRLENDWEILTGKILLNYIVMSNHLKPFLAPLSLSLIDMHH